MKMPKYAMLDFDPTDTQDQFAIVYNNHADGSGDCHIEWFDTEDQRSIQVEKDINKEIVFLIKWKESQYA
jgi:hypothetical protein